MSCSDCGQSTGHGSLCRKAKCSRCGQARIPVHGHGNLCGCPSSVATPAPSAAKCSKCSGCGKVPTKAFGICDCHLAPQVRVHVSRTAPTEPPPAMSEAPVGRYSDSLRVCGYCGAKWEAGTLAPHTASCGLRDSRAGRPESPPPYGEISNFARYVHADAVDRETKRANRLADECGALRSENTALLAENAKLRRDVERLTRKGGRR